MLSEIAWTLTHGKFEQRRLHRSLPSRETVCVKFDGYCQIKCIYLYAPYLEPRGGGGLVRLPFAHPAQTFLVFC